MFFGSDKDFRKGVSTNKGKPAIITSRLPSAIVSPPKCGDALMQDNVVEKSKKDREMRRKTRDDAAKAVVIQSWWRGKYISLLHFRAMRLKFDAKIADITKLSVILVSRGLVFITPLPTIIELMQLLLFQFLRDNCDINRLILFCSQVLNPSLTQMDASKNGILSFSRVDEVLRPSSTTFSAIVRFLRVIERSLLCSGTSISGDFTEATAALCNTMVCICGTERPYKLRYPEIIESSFALTIHTLIDGGLFKVIRRVLSRASQPLLRATAGSEEDVFGDTARSSSSRRHWPAVDSSSGDKLINLCLTCLDSGASPNPKWVLEFSREVLTVEALTRHLSGRMLTRLANCKHIHSILDWAASPSLALPPATHGVFQSSQWLLGNLCVLSTALHILPSDGQTSNDSPDELTSSFPTNDSSIDITSNSMLIKYLSLVSCLLLRHGVSGVLQGSSGVVFVRDGSNLTAAGVPIALRDQISLLLSPSFIHRLYIRGLVPVRMEVDELAVPADVSAIRATLSSSAMQIVGDELVDTQQDSRWFSSKWAQKLLGRASRSLGVASGASAGAGTATPSSGPIENKSKFDLPDAVNEFSEDLYRAIIGLCAVLFPPAAVLSSPTARPWKNLSKIVFSNRIVDRLWVTMCACEPLSQSKPHPAGATTAASAFSSIFSMFSASSTPPKTTKATASQRSNKRLRRLVSSFDPSGELDKSEIFGCMGVLSALLRIALVAHDDTELYTTGRPLPLHQIISFIEVAKELLYRMLQSDPFILADAPAGGGSVSDEASAPWDCKATYRLFRYSITKAISLVISDLHGRWARKPFCSSRIWEMEDANSASALAELKDGTPFAVCLLNYMPWSMQLLNRMKWFRNILDTDKLEIQGSNDSASLFSAGGGYRSKGVIVKVRRARVLEDGMQAFDKIGSSLKDRIVVRYISNFGEEEAGIDAGGLFKDFLTDLSRRIFDPSFGLFKSTASHALFPNPAAIALFGEHEIDRLFCFVGRVLGKAIFENITVQPQFAHFFLSQTDGKYNYMNLIDDLASFDPELYKNLMFLKSYEGDIEDLCLTFSVTEDSLGVSKEVDLIPGGGAIAVTAENRLRYIHCVAKYHLHDRVHLQSKAFFRGVHQVISPHLFRMFCAPELQIIISGAKSGISVADLKENTRYNGYSSIDRSISSFWNVVTNFSEADRGALLKFVTSCERPPSLGFSSLHPPFTIQRVDCADDSRLPTASTCFNILKLPTYSSESVLREKLLASIHSGAGFDLS